MGILDDLGGLAKEHEQKIEEGIEKAGDLVDEKTEGKYADKVDQAQDFANEQLDKLTGK
ncbi:antitoxin [Tessaracoccus sp. HDW20]|nr:antitoxin [Tessaracoccus coleopterorum]